MTASPAQPPATPDPWVAYRTPSPEHAKLARFTGQWNAVVSIWTAPDAPPRVFSMKAETEMVLGDRYQRTKLLGLPGGMIYEEISYLGFNNATAQFTRTSLHTFATGQLTLAGGWLQTDQIIELKGETIDPVTRQPIHVRQRITFLDLNTILLENFDRPADRPEMKTMEHHLTRVASATP